MRLPVAAAIALVAVCASFADADAQVQPSDGIPAALAHDIARMAAVLTSSLELLGPATPLPPAARPQTRRAPGTIINAGVGVLDGSGGIYGRISQRLGWRASVHLVGHYALSEPGGLIDSPQALVELAVVYRGWRGGVLARKHVPAFTAGVTTVYTESYVLGVVAGYGVALDREWVRATAALDLIAAPLVTKDNFYDGGGTRSSYTDSSSSYVGGRLGVTTNVGLRHVGLSVDGAIGFMPGLDTRFYVLGTAALYLAF